MARSGTEYVQTWAHPFGHGSRAAIAVAAANVVGDGRLEIYFAAADTLTRLNGDTRREAAVYRGESPFYCRDIAIADLSGDGDREVVCVGGPDDYLYGEFGRILVLDAVTLAPEWESPDLDVGRSLAVGNVDADPALEIVTSGGFVYDGASLANTADPAGIQGRALPKAWHGCRAA